MSEKKNGENEHLNLRTHIQVMNFYFRLLTCEPNWKKIKAQKIFMLDRNRTMKPYLYSCNNKGKTIDASLHVV